MANFNVHFNVADMEGKAVLVFLKPESPRRNCRIHAWRVLIGTEGSTQSFEHESSHYYHIIQANVTPVDGGLDSPLISDRAGMFPGQLFEAVSLDGHSPTLRQSAASLAQTKLSPEQCGVINRMNPFTLLDCHWFVEGLPVATMPHVDTNMTVSFEYLQHLYFMVAKPPVAGQTFSISDFSAMAQYLAPIRALNVDIELTRKNERWAFEFSSDG